MTAAEVEAERVERDKELRAEWKNAVMIQRNVRVRVRVRVRVSVSVRVSVRVRVRVRVKKPIPNSDPNQERARPSDSAVHCCAA